MNLWSFIRYGITSRLSSNGQSDAIRSTPAKAGSAQGQETVGRFFPWGFDSRMPTGGTAVLVAPSGGSQLVQVGSRHDQYPPDYGDSEWSQILHNEKSGTWVKLRKDGGVQVQGSGAKIEITAAGAISILSKTGQDIKLNITGTGSTVMRQGDPVIPTSDMVFWMGQVALALNTIAPGSVFPVQPPTFGVADGGAPNVKA